MAVLVALLVGGILLSFTGTPAHAQGTPNGCTQNRFFVDIGLAPDQPLFVIPGQTVHYLVSYGNNAANRSDACDTLNVAVNFPDLLYGRPTTMLDQGGSR
jgi:hypothetical protein